jgi:uncharacterized protein (TIGR03118 family)
VGQYAARPGCRVQVNLVSDIAGLATITDPQLVNPWGVAHSTTSPFWTSNQGTSTATLYMVTDRTTVTKVPINGNGIVKIPTTATGPQGPTGQVNNSNNLATGCNVSGGIAFPVKNGGDGNSAHFIFANLNGTISAWDTGATAFIQVTAASGTVYTGLAINGAPTRLYAANVGTGSVDVYDCTFAPVNLGADAFVNPALPDGLVPFNVQEIGGNVYVAYAPAGRPAQQNAPLGAGAVAIFDEDGNFITQLIAGSRLAAPWGMTLASAGFGKFINQLLVGNFSYLHSEINAFDPTNGKHRGTLPITLGKGRTPGGLWFIGFGVGGSNGDPNTLYFADGINGENDGLFGAIFANGNGS